MNDFRTRIAWVTCLTAFLLWGALATAADYSCTVQVNRQLYLCESYGNLEAPFLSIIRDRCGDSQSRNRLPWLRTANAATALTWQEKACPTSKALGQCAVQQFDVAKVVTYYHTPQKVNGKPNSLAAAYSRAFAQCQLEEGKWQRSESVALKFPDSAIDVEQELNSWTQVSQGEMAKAMAKIDAKVKGSRAAACLTLVNNKPNSCEYYEGLTQAMSETQQLLCDNVGMGMAEVAGRWDRKCPEAGWQYACLAIAESGLKTTSYYYEMKGRDAAVLAKSCNKRGKWLHGKSAQKKSP